MGCSRASLVVEPRPLGVFWRCVNCRAVYSVLAHLTAYQHRCANTADGRERKRCFVCGLAWTPKKKEVARAPKSDAA